MEPRTVPFKIRVNVPVEFTVNYTVHSLKTSQWAAQLSEQVDGEPGFWDIAHLTLRHEERQVFSLATRCNSNLALILFCMGITYNCKYPLAQRQYRCRASPFSLSRSAYDLFVRTYSDSNFSPIGYIPTRQPHLVDSHFSTYIIR